MTAREKLAGIRDIFYRPTVSRRSAIIFLSMAIVFVIAIFMRIYPAMYGWYINEFDPYFDYYASLHVVTLAQQHGLWYALFNQVSCPTVPTAQTLRSALNCQDRARECKKYQPAENHDQENFDHVSDIHCWISIGSQVICKKRECPRENQSKTSDA